MWVSVISVKQRKHTSWGKNNTIIFALPEKGRDMVLILALVKIIPLM